MLNYLYIILYRIIELCRIDFKRVMKIDVQHIIEI